MPTPTSQSRPYINEKVEGDVNAIVQEYLEQNGFEKTTRAFSSELKILNRPCVEKLMNNDRDQATDDASSSELLSLFDSGKRDDFFLELDAVIPSSIRDLEPKYQQLQFDLQIYFAIYPLRNESKKTNLEAENAMHHFKHFLESKGDTLSRTSEFLPYYALPYVSDPSQHPSFTNIFRDEWVHELRGSLEGFLSHILLKKGNSQLFELYCSSQNHYHIQVQLDEVLQKLASERQKRLTLQECYQKLMLVTTELLAALESSIQGHPIDLSRVTNTCSKVYPELFGEKRAEGNPSHSQLVNGSSVDTSPELMSFIRSKTHALILVSLDYKKLMFDLVHGTEQMKALVLQALRWRLTHTVSSDQCHLVIHAYIQNDLLGCSHEGSYRGAIIGMLGSPTLIVQQSLSRLFNAFASLTSGRLYLSSCLDVVRALIDNVKKPALDQIVLDMLLATLQKLSLRRHLQIVMIDHGVMEWLVSLLEDEDSLTDYTLEYAAAFLMNLCLRSPGKMRCSQFPQQVLRVLTSLLGNQNQEIVSYINGALYSLLAVPYINMEAHSLGLEDLLKCVMKDSPPDMQHQLEFVLKQLNSENIMDDSGSDHNDIDDDDEEQDVLEEELEKNDGVIPSPGELQGEQLLATHYSLHSQKNKAAYSETENLEKSPQNHSPTPHNLVMGVDEKSYSPHSQLLDSTSPDVMKSTSKHSPTPVSPVPLNVDQFASEVLSEVIGIDKPIAEASQSPPLLPKATDKIRGRSLNEYVVAFSSRPRIPRTPDSSGRRRR